MRYILFVYGTHTLMRLSARVLLVPNLCVFEKTVHPFPHLGYGSSPLVEWNRDLLHNPADDLSTLSDAVGMVPGSILECQRCE
jgi:hypothetical protein